MARRGRGGARSSAACSSGGRRRPETVGTSAANGTAGAVDGSPGADGDAGACSSAADGTTAHDPDGSGANTPTRSPRRRALLVALPVLALGVGLGAGALLGLDSAVPSAGGGSSLAISGPEEIRVGEQAVFTAEVVGVHSWVWTLPTGEHLVDAEQATLTASGPGRAELVLRARTAEGQELEARRVVRVRA